MSYLMLRELDEIGVTMSKIQEWVDANSSTIIITKTMYGFRISGGKVIMGKIKPLLKPIEEGTGLIVTHENHLNSVTVANSAGHDDFDFEGLIKAIEVDFAEVGATVVMTEQLYPPRKGLETWFDAGNAGLPDPGMVPLPKNTNE